MKHLIAAALFAPLLGLAQESPKQPEDSLERAVKLMDSGERKPGVSLLDHYASVAAWARFYCSISATSGEDGRRCANAVKPPLQRAANAAARSLKSSAAKAALKEHLIASMSALDAVAPMAGELKIDYERRQAAHETKVQEALNRLNVEASR